MILPEKLKSIISIQYHMSISERRHHNIFYSIFQFQLCKVQESTMALAGSRHIINAFALVVVLVLSFLPFGSGSAELITSQVQFQEQIIESDQIWLVQFCERGSKNCEAYSTLYEEISGVLKGIVRVATIDVTEPESEFTKIMKTKYKMKSLPTLYIFGSDKKQAPTLLKGNHNIQEVVQEVLNTIVNTLQTRATSMMGSKNNQSEFDKSGDSSKLIQLNQSNFQSMVLDDKKNIWMVAFIAPWCGHCKALMPDWAEASKKLFGEGVLLGVVDATVETALAQQYGVKGFPTIKLFPGGPKTPSSAQDYQGGRSTLQIVQYALAEVDRTGSPKEILELTSQDVLQEKCSGSNKLCVVVALPHILDSGALGRNKYREVLAQVSKLFRGSPFEFLWFEGGNAQMELESTLEFTFGYPAVAAISLDKMAFAVQRGSFNEKAIGKFLNSIISGRQGTLPMQAPKVMTTQPWDGLDASPIEDEPLDDIMGEDWGEL